jgi:hypothetical protein
MTCRGCGRSDGGHPKYCPNCDADWQHEAISHLESVVILLEQHDRTGLVHEVQGLKQMILSSHPVENYGVRR